jgi:hypothetical protein
LLNQIDSFLSDDEGSGRAEVFRYDFDAPDTTGLPGGSLGNALETIIGLEDSGDGSGCPSRWNFRHPDPGGKRMGPGTERRTPAAFGMELHPFVLPATGGVLGCLPGGRVWPRD